LRYCHACDAQFPDEHAKCLHCGRRLQRERPAQSGAERDAAAPDAVRLLARRQPQKVVSLLEALSAADINFTVVAQGGTRHVDVVRGSYGRHAAIEVYVDAEQLAQAESVLREELAHLTEGLPEPVECQPGDCPACGSHVSELAPECPDCGLVFSK
jgi:hypothetical protein